MKRRIVSAVAVAALAWAPALAAESLFVDVTQEAGVGDAGNGKGAAFADIDNDGDWDLYVSNKGGANRLYRNNGDGTFTDITAEAGDNLGDAGFAMGSIFFDYDNDGWVDLYLAKGGRYEVEANRLLRNVGGRFVDVTEKAGVGSKAFTYAAAAADYDRDGYLDLYLANYGVGAKNQLFRNNGDGTFTEVTDQAGVGDRSWSWMAVWADVNGDGWQDLYVVNGRYPAGEPNRLYINNGDGTFRDASAEAGVADPHWGLGAAFADVDNDGDLDLFVSNYVGPNALYLNDGTGRFTEVGKAAGLADEGWGKGPTFGDIDHDGDLDLYEGDCKVANQLYRNNGDGTFTNIAERNPDVRCETVRTKGTTFADVDGDGDLDLYVVNWGVENRLFRNTLNDGNWLKVRLVGTISNRMAVGSRVWVRQGDRLVGMADLPTASGFCAQPPQELHFGVRAGETYTVEVRFPNGTRKVVTGVAPGQVLTIEEPRELASR
ncbi:CRTAC1 family protein [Deferrisoma sp.]